MGKKKSEPLRGPGDLEARLEAGQDPNADLADKQAWNKSQGALLLRMSGASWTEIARMQGYATPHHARLAVDAALAEAVGPEDREKARELQDRRYNRLLQSVMSRAIDPTDREHLAYNARAIAILDRISVLKGLNAPQQVTITPTDQYLQEYLQKMLPEAQKDRDAGEADILAGEIVDE